VVPQGWVFLPLADDHHVVVCDPAHPLAATMGATRLAFDTLADQTWLAAPAGTAVRGQFDRLTAHWPGGARLHPLVTRLLRPLESLLRGSALLTLMPQAFVTPLLRDGRLAVLALDAPLPPLPPLGLLQPDAALRPAAAALSEFLQARAGA
jgi:DNA-binding transcriptional LysR family regulator